MSNITREVIDTSFEDKVLTGMIVSDGYLEGVRHIYQSDYLNNDFGKLVASWCLDYYKSYSKAPGLHIEDIFEKKSKDIDPDSIELIKAFLNRISDEYAKAPHLHHDSMLADTEEEFNKRSLAHLQSDIKLALEQGESPTDIYDYLREQQDARLDVNENTFLESMVTSTELNKEKIKQPKPILWPWLREKSLNMIYAERGLGKSWLSMIIGVMVTREHYDNLSLGSWFVKRQCGTLYVDGEMGKADLQERFKQLTGPLGNESRRYPLVVFSTPDYTEKHGQTVNLNMSYWQDRFYKYFKNNRSMQLLILDNLSSLCPGREENDNQSTSIFNQWLIKLRALGVTVIIVHHSGKVQGQQRGASGLEDPLNNSICLSKPKTWEQGGGAHFTIGFTKSRNDPGGEGYRPFDIRVIEHQDNSKWRMWIEP